MTRRCSHCSNNGHNSRTCPARAAGGVRLFGVRLTEGVGSMKKSASMGNLATAAAAASSDPLRDHAAAATGYASDDPACSSNCRTDRKRGTPWTEEEHRMFLAGLQKLGKGDWRGIARNFVVSRTPTQVASHAQKYFIRQTNASRRKRRSSLFDIIPKTVDCMPIMEEELMLHSPPSEPEITNRVPSSNLGEAEVESHGLKEKSAYSEMPVAMIPAFYPTMIPVPFGFWSPTISSPAAPAKEQAERGKTHEVLKPIPVLPKDLLVNADAITGMSKLSIAEGPAARMVPSALSVKLKGERQSAFHVNPAIAGSRLSQNGNSPIHVL